jgi:hypothetical protein
MATQIPIEVIIKALNLTQPEIEKVKRELEGFKQSQRQALGEHREEVERARGAVDLLGQRFGIHLPRELKKFIAETKGVGAALSAAFNASVILAFAQIIYEAGKEVYELIQSLHKLTEEEKKALSEIAAEAKNSININKQLLDIERQKVLARTDEKEHARLKAKWQAEDAKWSEGELDRIRKIYDEAKKTKELFESGARTVVKKSVTGTFASTRATVSGDEYKNATGIIDTFEEIYGKGLVDLRNEAIITGAKVGLAAAQAAAAGKKAYGEELSAAMDQAAQAAKFLLSQLDQHVKKIAEVKNGGKAFSLADAEEELRFFELAFELNPEAKGAIQEGLEYWRQQVAKKSGEVQAQITAAGNAAGKSWVDGFVSEIAKIKEKTLPHLGPSLLNIGETSGQDPRQMSISSEPKFDEMSAQMKRIQSISEQVGEGFTGMFTELVDGTHSVSDAFANMARSIAASIMQIVAKMIVMAAVEKIVGAAIGAFGGGGGFHSGGTATVLSQDAFGMTLAGTRAGGGPVSANMPYLIGERGPELFVPNSSGSVVPNGGFGGSSVQVNIINETGSQVRKSESAPQFDGKKWVQNIILEDVASNGPIGQAWKSRR